MTPLELLHAHPVQRARQLRWVIPLTATLLGAVLLVLAVQYVVSEQQVQAEFFHAHKTVSHTGQLLRRGTLAGGVALALTALAIGVWALRASHRFVRPAHTLHRALIELAAGDLGVRVELRRNDEFQEVGEALNQLVTAFSDSLGRVHALADQIGRLSEQVVAEPHDEPNRALLHERVSELDAALEFFRLTPRRVIRDERA